MKKIIILGLAALAFGSVKAQFASNDSFFIKQPVKNEMSVPVIYLNKEDFNSHLDSFRREGIRFSYIKLDTAGNLIGEVIVNVDFPEQDMIGSIRYIFEDKQFGIVKMIIIKGDESILER
jgi:hypothetical protein